MPRLLCLIACFLLSCAPVAASSENFVAFDGASASSSYSHDVFAAKQALNAGSGYWCSAGNHNAAQSVTWTGSLNVRRKAVGVKLNWAYGPGEVKVLVSGDGGNFAEAACWRSASRSEVSYEDVIMFDVPQMVKSLTIVMKAPMPWGYFGLNDVSLLSSGDESFMLVSGRSSSEGEHCLIASGLELGAAACLDAVAAGDGREVFAFRGEQLMHTASSMCVAVPSAESKRVVLQNCKNLATANDGRGAFELAPHGQLKMPRSGNSCIVLVDGQPVVKDCSEAARLGDASDQFAMAAVPEVDVQAASSARMAAALLSAATSRQRSALNRLEELLPSLATCRFAVVAHNSSRLLKQASFMRNRQAVREPLGLPADAALAAVKKIYGSIGADIDGSLQLVHDSATVLAAAHSKLTPSA